MHSHHRVQPTRRRGLWATALIPLTATAALTEPQQRFTDYLELTNTYRSATNFNVETVRGVEVSPGGRVLMLNTHGSRIVRWDGQAGVGSPAVFPTTSSPTVNNPISFGTYLWEGGHLGPIEYAVVLGGGSHALALHDLSTMRITNSVTLPAEPGDMVVHQDLGVVFVSLPGNNTVQQYGLPDLDLRATFTVASQRPRFLYVDLGQAGLGDDRVYVAPELSGNGTGTQAALQIISPAPSGPVPAAVATPTDFHTFDPAGLLPDEDLFEITPYTSPTGPVVLGAVPVLRNLATLQMAHGKHPTTGKYWLVGVDSRNAAALTEPLQKGKFARNILTIADAPNGGATPLPYSHTVIDLDLAPGGTGYNSAFSVSFPYAIGFHPSGFAAIAGAASDQVRVTLPDGSRFGDLELPPGSIPRQLTFGFGSSILFVYCWGTNEVRAYDVGALVTAIANTTTAPVGVVSPGTALIGTFELGADPLPPALKRGREIFYDADNSADGRFTCNHCHPGGGMDLLGWSIQDFPHDHKDMMVTQSLKSIEDTFPYHWRGERDLEAFNGAFKGLLGGAELSTSPDGGDLDKFKAFVFSLQAHANPLQHESRMLDDAFSRPQESFIPTTSSVVPKASIGQTLLSKPNTLLGRFSCVECHAMPSGTSGDPGFDDFSPVPTNTTMDVAHLRQLFSKQQDLVDFTYGGATFRTLRGGFGISHDGDNASVLDFLRRAGFTLQEDEEEHIAAFVAQFDEGIAPVAHHVYTIDANTSDQDALDIEARMITGQAGSSFTADHWVSLAIIGSHEDLQGAVHDLTWFYAPVLGVFLPSDGSVTFPDGVTGSQTWAALVKDAQEGRATFSLVGLPPGNAIRFAVDRDDDGLTDLAEAAQNPPTNPDRYSSDLDRYPDGYEVLHGMNPHVVDAPTSDTTAPQMLYSRVEHEGATFAKLVMVFDEPATLEITATNPLTQHSVTEVRRAFRAFDTVTVQRLQGSLPAVVFSSLLGYPMPVLIGIPFQYQVSVKMTDYAGNSATQPLSGTVTTLDQQVPAPYLEIPSTWRAANGGLNPAALSRIVEDLAWAPGQSAVGPKFTATAKATARLDGEPALLTLYASTNPLDRPNGSTTPHQNQVIAAQVLLHDTVADTWSVVPVQSGGTTGLALAPATNIVSSILFPGSPFAGTLGGSGLAGPYVLSTASTASGAVSFAFRLNAPLAPTQEIKLNIIGVFEHDLNASPAQAANTFWPGSIVSYNMPMTAVENRGLISP
ncbi:MAG: hypothetical protein R3F49_13530 [Planctomycetota bacterium]